MSKITITGENIEIHDGYHSMNEIYAHRAILYVALVKHISSMAWKSKRHQDGSTYDGWFILGVELPTGQISYHVPEKFWDKLPEIKELEASPFDGHTSDDVLKRLTMWICGE
jgi:hypothetical protein